MVAVLLAVGLLRWGSLRPGPPGVVVAPRCGARCVAVATGVVDGSQIHDVVRPLAAPLAFVLVAVPLAASLDHVGVFHELAAFAARSRHVVGALWILAALVVALLNLDAAVVLLTPLYIRTALLVDVDPVALAFQPVLLASLASGVLVVSNLTNLLAASHLSLQNTDFLRHLALPSLAASAVGWFAYRRGLSDPASGCDGRAPVDRRALVVGLGAIALFLVCLLGGEPFGVPAWAAALATEVVLIGFTRRLPWRQAPVGTVVAAARSPCWPQASRPSCPTRSRAWATAGSEASPPAWCPRNVLNNLPAVLVGLTHVSTPAGCGRCCSASTSGRSSCSPARWPACSGRRAPGGPGSRSTPGATRRSGLGRPAGDGGGAWSADPGLTPGHDFVSGSNRHPEWRENGGRCTAAVRFDLHIPQSRSLKAKRAAIRPIVDGLRHRFRVSVAEVDHHDQWQRAAIAVAVVAGSDSQLREVLASIERFVVAAADIELLDVETAWLESERA